jgi:SAM-dependent methyltransferase
LSAYLWSHYADLFGDPEATAAYSEWAALISPAPGAALDAGCAAGRFCFEMSRKCDFVIGVDLSETFISTARRIMEERKLDFQIKEEGGIHSARTFSLPARWDPDKVEFIVADAAALPFRSASFGCVVSLNLIDKIAGPLEHIGEADRVARPREAQLLLSDPFSWSETVCAPDRWLGGAPGGKFAGYGMDNIIGLLSGRERTAPLEWKITRRGSVWWKIRNHRNHFELIRSLFVKAER